MTVIDEDWVAARVGAVASTPSDDRHASVVRLRGLLDRWAAKFVESAPARNASALVLPRRGLRPDEAAAFLRAMDDGFASVDEAGFVTLTGVRPKTPPGRYSLFSRGRAGPAVNLEYLLQIGAAAELATTYGWPAGRLDFERGPFDVLGFDEDGRVSLAVEAKARVTGADGLEKLLRSWLRFGDAGGEVPATNAGRKYAELGRLCRSGPVAVWLVAAGARWSLRAAWTGNGIALMTGRPPAYDETADRPTIGREVLWTRSYDSSLHRHAGRGAGGKCSWLCDEPAVWSTRVREAGGGESTFALCDAHRQRVEDDCADDARTGEEPLGKRPAWPSSTPTWSS